MLLDNAPRVFDLTANSETSGDLWIALALLFFLLIIAAVGLLTVFGRVGAKRRRLAARACLSAVGVIVIGMVVLSVFAIQGTIAADDRANAYRASVGDWLSGSYNLDASDTAIDRLLTGSSFIVVHDGVPTTVSIVPTLDGHIGLVDENRQPLVAVER